MADSEILKEFQQPYLYMLSSKDEDKNEEYRYRLLSNIFLDTTYNPKHDPKYLYLFGIFPCHNIPASYIPFNYKQISRNFNRISKNNSFTKNNYKEVLKPEYTDSKILAGKLDNLIKGFRSKHSIYNNLYTTPFVIILVIFWTLIILAFMYIFYFYNYYIFNYILAIILFVLLMFAIIFKMFYIIHNS
jgi:hypothetical protein